MKKKLFSGAAILGGILILFSFSSCVKEESETSVMYYNLLDANGNQVNVSVNTTPDPPKPIQ